MHVLCVCVCACLWIMKRRCNSYHEEEILVIVLVRGPLANSPKVVSQMQVARGLHDMRIFSFISISTRTCCCLYMMITDEIISLLQETLFAGAACTCTPETTLFFTAGLSSPPVALSVSVPSSVADVDDDRHSTLPPRLVTIGTFMKEGTVAAVETALKLFPTHILPLLQASCGLVLKSGAVLYANAVMREADPFITAAPRMGVTASDEMNPIAVRTMSFRMARPPQESKKRTLEWHTYCRNLSLYVLNFDKGWAFRLKLLGPPRLRSNSEPVLALLCNSGLGKVSFLSFLLSTPQTWFRIRQPCSISAAWMTSAHRFEYSRFVMSGLLFLRE